MSAIDQDQTTRFLELLEEQIASYEKALPRGKTVTLDVDALTAPLRRLAARIA